MLLWKVIVIFLWNDNFKNLNHILFTQFVLQEKKGLFMGIILLKKKIWKNWKFVCDIEGTWLYQWKFRMFILRKISIFQPWLFVCKFELIDKKHKSIECYKAKCVNKYKVQQY